MKHYQPLTESEFSQRFPLLSNHLNPDAPGNWGDQPGCLFGTSGEESAFVRKQSPDTVWTLVDHDDWDQRIVSGFVYVNRIGYFVSREARPAGQLFQVFVEP